MKSLCYSRIVLALIDRPLVLKDICRALEGRCSPGKIEFALLWLKKHCLVGSYPYRNGRTWELTEQSLHSIAHLNFHYGCSSKTNMYVRERRARLESELFHTSKINDLKRFNILNVLSQSSHPLLRRDLELPWNEWVKARDREIVDALNTLYAHQFIDCNARPKTAGAIEYRILAKGANALAIIRREMRYSPLFGLLAHPAATGDDTVVAVQDF